MTVGKYNCDAPLARNGHFREAWRAGNDYQTEFCARHMLT